MRRRLRRRQLPQSLNAAPMMLFPARPRPSDAIAQTPRDRATASAPAPHWPAWTKTTSAPASIWRLAISSHAVGSTRSRSCSRPPARRPGECARETPRLKAATIALRLRRRAAGDNRHAAGSPVRARHHAGRHEPTQRAGELSRAARSRTGSQSRSASPASASSRTEESMNTNRVSSSSTCNRRERELRTVAFSARRRRDRSARPSSLPWTSERRRTPREVVGEARSTRPRGPLARRRRRAR